MLGVKIQLFLVALYIFWTDAASIKRTIDDSPLQNEITTETSKQVLKKSPAIVAIEIVDEPQQNVTGKNSKRTIESSLGYGYNGPLNSYDYHNSNHGKKFVIYKYSQENIPPSSHYNFLGTSYSKPYNSPTDIQKSISYNLGTITTQVTHKPKVENITPAPLYHTPTEPTTQYYNPANTLYTTFDQQSLGGVSNQVPYQNQAHSGIVPVIFLKVYSNQLTNSNTPLYTNLPQSNPYADLNNINLQAYLQNYLQQYLQSQQITYQPVYQHSQQAYVQNYQQQEEYPTNLPTYENYPSSKHTGVIFHSDNNGHIPLTKQNKVSDHSSYKSISYPMYIAPHQSQSNVEVQQPNLQYMYTTDDKSSDQAYMYVYPDNIYQNIYYQDSNSNAYYEPNENYKESTNEQEIPNQPYNYHAHPTKSAPKERRSKQSETEITTPSYKRDESGTENYK